ncbi:sugar ABC transporter ATP-binding protein [Anoxynatronum sibiricum]|uniref:Sugar ABC transporter ATP-binding protein n=1 Tax=Anoxynatronum sibiricum TaxID=210623 RepID=A0ABU9VUL5_9CLOT
MAVVLEGRKLTKIFQESIALKDVSFTLRAGEIHGIVGANGSGKSTLMNILYGSRVIRETGGYEGCLIMEGNEVKFNSTKDANKAGVGMVHQELALVRELEAAENIKLNREHLVSWTKKVAGKQLGYVHCQQNREDARKIFRDMGITLDPATLVGRLSISMKQMVEIAREMDKNDLKVLLLDEPTAPLGPTEAKWMMNAIRLIAERGTAVVFISHRLEEVAALCHRITVLRDGVIAAQYDHPPDFDVTAIAQNMIGRTVLQASNGKRRTIKKGSKPLLSFEQYGRTTGAWAGRPTALELYEGEILGITGMAGQGQEMFGYGLFGLLPVEGTVTYQGKTMKMGNVEELVQQGMYLLPDERKELGILGDSPIWKNIVIGKGGHQQRFLKYPSLKGLSPLRQDAIQVYADQIIQQFQIKCLSYQQPVGQLSGGNQQKVCIARAITTHPKVLFIGEPTRGIDIYSKERILEMLLTMREDRGLTIVVSSGELSELRRICDRIAIMYEGCVVDVLTPEQPETEFSRVFAGRRRSTDDEN